MDERTGTALKGAAILLTLTWAGWAVYDSDLGPPTAETQELAAAGKFLADGQLEDALEAYETALLLRPANLGALRGVAQALLQLGTQAAAQAEQLRLEGKHARSETLLQRAESHYQRALSNYNEAIGRQYSDGTSDTHRIQGVTYANRGILKDRMGDHRGALSDYRMAMKLEPKVVEGPGLLTRFMRNQADRPPTVADRADYLEKELEKPTSEQVMRVHEEDIKQRSYLLD
ncbi:MAG: hypothetical protein GY703_15230 [Gammaproteobacteria bacterium]|nr:hypothetical protein [Gammaproteobacteria bacterium]